MPPEPFDTCWTVLRSAAGGDTVARSVFARSYAAPIRAYLADRWRGGRFAGELEDALQDAFVECYRPGGVLERADPSRGEFRALLYGVVRNVARRYEERSAERGHAVQAESAGLDQLPHRDEALSQVFDRAWAQALLREAVQRHESEASAGDAAAQRRFRILRLRHDDGLPVREIATALGEPEVTRVHEEYRRARREFAVHLRATVSAHTGAKGEAIDAECRRLTGLLGS